MAAGGAKEGQGRTLPKAPDAEVSVLGAMVIHNNTIDLVAPILKPEAFAEPPHRSIYQAILALHEAKSPVDLVSLSAELERQGVLEKAGGEAYLMDVVDAVPAAANAEHYALIVREKWTLRSLIGASEQILDRAYKGRDHDEDLLDEAMKLVYDIAERNIGSRIVNLGDVLRDVFDQLEKGREDRYSGVPSGYHDLDDLTNGFQPGELIILAARPSMGKTTLAMNIARHIGVQLQMGVAIFSLEMDPRQIATNMLCCQAKVDSHRLRRGRVKGKDLEKLAIHVGVLASAPIFIDDSGKLTPMQLRAKARRLCSQFDVRLIIIDYLQLMSCPGAESRQVEVSRISRDLKALARELRIPILAVAQLNRGVEDRADNRPRMADLRESGSLEQDADVVALLHRAAYYRSDREDDGATELIIVKQRNGPTGKVNLTFLKSYLRFEAAALPGQEF